MDCSFLEQELTTLPSPFNNLVLQMGLLPSDLPLLAASIPWALVAQLRVSVNIGVVERGKEQQMSLVLAMGPL